MTVRELIEALSKLDPELEVYEKRSGEVRLLRDGDVSVMSGIEDEFCADGDPLPESIVMLTAWD